MRDNAYTDVWRKFQSSNCLYIFLARKSSVRDIYLIWITLQYIHMYQIIIQQVCQNTQSHQTCASRIRFMLLCINWARDLVSVERNSRYPTFACDWVYFLLGTCTAKGPLFKYTFKIFKKSQMECNYVNYTQHPYK